MDRFSATQVLGRFALALGLMALAGVGCGDECASDGDCAAGQACGANGQCGPPAAQCATSDQCESGLICVTEIGQCHQCIRDANCPPNNTCVALQCVPKDDPEPEEDVAEPEPEPDAAEPEPEPDAAEPEPEPEPEPVGCDPDCPGLQICDEASNRCLEPRICLSDIDCLSNKVCFATRCLDERQVIEAGGCFDDETCEGQGEFLFCNLEGHTCLPSGRCNNDNECPGDLACAPDGLCRQCADNSDCPGGLSCESADEAFVCVEGDRCNGNDDCRGDRRCQGGACTEPSCTEDDFEPNEACGRATAVEDDTFDDLTVCGAGCDWYALDVDSGDGFVVRVAHDPDHGDLDLTLHSGPCAADDPGQILQRAASLDPNEIVSVPRVFSPGTFFFSVCPFITEQDGGTNTYDLDVMRVPGGFCVDDVFDENSRNDIPTRASQITIPDRPFNLPTNNLQICPEAEDWYRLQLLEDDFLTVTIDLNDAFGDLDLCIYDRLPLFPPDPRDAVACSTGRNASEALSLAADRTGEVFVRVFSPNGGQNRYDMRLNVTSGCTDTFEPNDIIGDAADLSGLPPTTFSGLRLCGEELDEDWFAAEVEPGQAVVVTATYDADLGVDLRARAFANAQASPVVISGTGGTLSFALVPSTPGGQVFFALNSTGLANVTYTLRYETRPADEICIDDERANRTAADAFPAEFGVREYRGVVCPADRQPGVDFFRLSVPAGTLLFADILNPAPGLDVQILSDDGLRVLGPGGPGDFGRSAFAQINAQSQVLVAVRGATAEDQGSYLLQIYSQPVPEGAQCTDDLLEEGSVMIGADNDDWDNAREISTGAFLRNLLLCPTDRDFYKFFVIAGQSVSVTIQTHEPLRGAIKARVHDVFGPDFPIFPVITSEGGTLQFNVDGIEVLDGGLWSIEIFSDQLETVWYDLRVITN